MQFACPKCGSTSTTVLSTKITTQGPVYTVRCDNPACDPHGEAPPGSIERENRRAQANSEERQYGDPGADDQEGGGEPTRGDDLPDEAPSGGEGDEGDEPGDGPSSSGQQEKETRQGDEPRKGRDASSRKPDASKGRGDPGKKGQPEDGPDGSSGKDEKGSNPQAGQKASGSGENQAQTPQRIYFG